jgi:hypothetical protein
MVDIEMVDIKAAATSILSPVIGGPPFSVSARDIASARWSGVAAAGFFETRAM